MQYAQTHSLNRMQGLGPDCALHARVYNLFLLLILGDADCHNVLHFMPIKLKCRLLQYSASRAKQTQSTLYLSKSSFCLYICLMREGNTWYELPLLPTSVVLMCLSLKLLWCHGI